jgi:16S rRNA (guanine(966)-N(2))-methyltransferase RsmD
VEKDLAAVGIIRQNLKKTEMEDRAKVLQTDFRSALRKLSREGETFDIVFLDPPYHQDAIVDAVVTALGKQRVITNDSVIVLEHFGKTETPKSIAGLPLNRTRAYGQTSISFYRKEL